MQETHFKKIDLVCPCCRKITPDGLAVSHLDIDEIIQKDEEYLIYGFLKCENPECNIKYPIIEGVPCIINPNEKYWWADLVSVLGTLNLPDKIKKYIMKLQNKMPKSEQSSFTDVDLPSYEEESLLGCFLDFNYCEFAPNYKPSYQWADYRSYWKTIIKTSKPNVGQEYDRTIELGCSVGRYVFELARMSRLAVGLDLRFRSVLEAVRFQRKGTVAYNRRERALKFEEVQTNFKPPENLLFLVGDALNPPFLKESFDLVTSLNLLDNVKLPRILLGQMNALLRSGGTMILGSPYDWNPEICDFSEWLENEKNDASEMVKNILIGNELPEYGLDFSIESEEDISWPLRNHDRYWSIFRVNLLRAKKG